MATKAFSREAENHPLYLETPDGEVQSPFFCHACQTMLNLTVIGERSLLSGCPKCGASFLLKGELRRVPGFVMGILQSLGETALHGETAPLRGERDRKLARLRAKWNTEFDEHSKANEEEPPTFAEELADLLYRFSKENGSDTPDYILACFLEGVLKGFDEAVRRRERVCYTGQRESEADLKPI